MTEFNDTMQPIIELAYSQMRMEQENEIVRAVQSVGVNVDKERLIQALTDARRFWQEGYEACMEWKPRWISVEERLPEQEQTVLLICKNGSRFCGFYRFDYVGEVQWKIWTALGSARCLNKGRVTHWMPLPEPPEVEV